MAAYLGVEASFAVYEDPLVTLLVCKTPQGSIRRGPGRGYRMTLSGSSKAGRMDAKALCQPETCGMNSRNAVDAVDQCDWNVDLGQADIRRESKADVGR